MAFSKKTWKDRLVEYAGRRQFKRVSGDPNGTMIVDVTRYEGTVSQAGDAFSAANMNDLEQRIADEFGNINSNLSELIGSLADTGWVTLNSSYLTRYRKKNGIVTVCSAFNRTVSSAITIGTLPAGYRPPLEFTALDAVQGGLRLSIHSDGVVKAVAVNLSTYHEYCYATISYPV